MAESRELKCLLLPLGGMTVILPSSAVAEVITVDDASSHRLAHGQSPDWLLGLTRWRGIDVPLVAFDRLCRAREDVPAAAGRFVVLYGVNENPGFYGLRIEALPRNETVDDATLRPIDGGGPAAEKFVQSRSVIDTRECAIPDFDALESAIAAHTPISP
ncbi:MAG: chemotaxis protein CheW [Halofilum sp. (in: g-proteobacteria)]